MKKKIIYITLSIFIIGIFFWVYRFDIKEYYFSKHVIYWSKDIDIKASDFQAEINENSGLNISWYHGLFLNSNGLKTAKVKAFFDKEKSWIRDTTDFTRKMKLQKLRFDLFSAYARKFKKHIDQVRGNKETKYSDLEKIGEKIFFELQIKENEIINSNLTIEEKVKKWTPIIEEMYK